MGTDEKLSFIKNVLGPCLSSEENFQAPPLLSSKILGTPPEPPFQQLKLFRHHPFSYQSPPQHVFVNAPLLLWKENYFISNLQAK